MPSTESKRGEGRRATWSSDSESGREGRAAASWGVGGALGVVVSLSEDQVALRPSPRFDSVEGIARLAVFPLDATETKSRAGWTVPVAKPKRRRSREIAPLVAAWSVAVLVAIAIVLF